MIVKDALHELFVRRGTTVIFGNPGSTELPFLAGLDDAIEYVTALQEASVAAMAAGYTLTTGLVPMVSVHSAPGLGNALGALHNMAEAHLPVVVIAGQQDSRHLNSDPVLSADLVRIADGNVKWARQPARAVDVPATFERAFRTATSGTPGPVLLAVPMDFFEQEGVTVVPRDVRRGGGASGEAIASLSSWLDEGPCAVVVGSRVALTGAWDATIELVERLGCPVYTAALDATPGFPSDHPQNRGQVGLTVEGVRRGLAAYSRILVLGAAAFRIYPYSEGPMLENAEVCVISDVEDDLTTCEVPGPLLLLADLPSTVAALAHAVPQHEPLPPREPRARTQIAAQPDASNSPLAVKAACERIGRLRLNDDTILVDESISSAGALLRYWPRRKPLTYIRSTDGGLGFGIPAAVGAAVGNPDASVVAVIGDGSFYYSPQALWTAAQRGLDIKFVVLNNGGYKILHDYHLTVSAHLGELPPLRLPGTNICSIAEGFGVPSMLATNEQEADDGIAFLTDTKGPALLELKIEWSDKSIFV